MEVTDHLEVQPRRKDRPMRPISKLYSTVLTPGRLQFSLRTHLYEQKSATDQGKDRRDIWAEKQNTSRSISAFISMSKSTKLASVKSIAVEKNKAFKRRLKHQKMNPLRINVGKNKIAARSKAVPPNQSSSTSFQLLKNVALSMNIRPSFIKCLRMRVKMTLMGYLQLKSRPSDTQGE